MCPNTTTRTCSVPTECEMRIATILGWSFVYNDLDKVAFVFSLWRKESLVAATLKVFKEAISPNRVFTTAYKLLTEKEKLHIS